MKITKILQYATIVAVMIMLLIVISVASSANYVRTPLTNSTILTSPTPTPTPIPISMPSITSPVVSDSSEINYGVSSTATWTWNQTINSYTTSITITNSGDSSFTPVLQCNIISDSNWNFTSSLSPLTIIQSQGQLQITMTAQYVGNGTVPTLQPDDLGIAVTM